eukprot:5891793-Amphidinium_carterae.2
MLRQLFQKLSTNETDVDNDDRNVTAKASDVQEEPHIDLFIDPVPGKDDHQAECDDADDGASGAPSLDLGATPKPSHGLCIHRNYTVPLNLGVDVFIEKKAGVLNVHFASFGVVAKPNFYKSTLCALALH